MKMIRFNLSLRESTYQGLKAISSSHGVPVTHTLRQLSMTLCEAVETGGKRCITGEACILGYMPSMTEKSKFPGS